MKYFFPEREGRRRGAVYYLERRGWEKNPVTVYLTSKGDRWGWMFVHLQMRDFFSVLC